jgi:hypothetical protein
MAGSPNYSPILLLVAAIAILAGMQQFVDSQNTCLFQQGNDLSTAVSRKAYAECMAAKKYHLKDGCKAGATTPMCYERLPE